MLNIWKSGLGLLIFLTCVYFSHGLRCFTCSFDTETGGSNPDTCTNNPAAIEGGFTECECEGCDHCYTSKIEYVDGSDRVIFNRGCCAVKDPSNVCPTKSSDFWEENELYKWHRIRCTGDLCNKGTGGGDDNNGGGGSGGVIIVNGKSSAMNCTASIGLIFTYVIISIVTISFRM